MSLELLGPALPPGWQQPSRGLVETSGDYLDNGLAAPSSPHLYVATPETPMEAFEYPEVAAGIQRLRLFSTPDNGTPIEGVGMAYPQLAQAQHGSVRALAMNYDMPDLLVESLQSEVKDFRNPYYEPIEEMGGEYKREGCFSVPGLNVIVWRWNAIMLYLPGQAPQVVTGVNAWILQHEIDHLHGIVTVIRWLQDQRYPLLYVPTEWARDLRKYRLGDEWPTVPLEQWLAMQSGEFDLAEYFQYL